MTKTIQLQLGVTRIPKTKGEQCITKVLTKDLFNNIINSEEVKDICFHKIPEAQAEHKDLKPVKALLPLLIFMAHCEDGQPEPTIANAIPTGYYIYDGDHMDTDIEAFFRLNIEPFIEEQQILLVHKSCSGTGIHIVARRRPGESIADAQKRMGDFLHFPCDPQVKNISRGSYAFPAEYLYYLDDKLFDLGEITIDTQEQSAGHSTEMATSPRPNDVVISPSEAPHSTDISPILPAFDYTDALSDCTLLVDSLKYEGVSLKDIVEALIERYGNNGSLNEGERNTLLYKIARELRPITHSEFEYTYTILAPFFRKAGLSDAEIRQTIASAISHEGGYTRNLSPILQNIVNSLKAQLNENVVPEIELPYDLMPPLMLRILECFPKRHHFAVLNSMLPMFGVWGTGIRFANAEGRMNSLSFLTVVCAEFGSGKGFVVHLNDMIMHRINEESDRELEIAEKERQERIAKANMTERQVYKKHPITVVSKDITYAQFVEQLYELGGKHGYSCIEELQDFLNNLGTAYSNKLMSIMKAAFDNGETSKSTKSDNTANVKFFTFWNPVFCGTYNVVGKLLSFNNVEDGTGSRCLIAELGDGLMEGTPHYKNLKPGDQKRLDNFLDKLREQGMESEDGTHWIRVDTLNNALETYIQEQINVYAEGGDVDFRKLANRSAVYGVRLGVLLWYMWGCPAGIANGKPREMQNEKMQKIIDFSIWFAHQVQKQQYRFLAKNMQKARQNSQSYISESYKPTDVLAMCPAEFTTTQFYEIKYRITGHRDTNPFQTLSRMEKKGLVTHSANGKMWKKIG